MQIQTINNRNCQKPSRNPSNRTKVKILKKKIFGIAHQKNLVPRMLSHRGNVRTSKFSRKPKEKKRIFFENLRRAYKDLIQVRKKFKIISCLCTFQINFFRLRKKPRSIGEYFSVHKFAKYKCITGRVQQYLCK